ncbi:glycine cleavage system protein GcvH [Hoyosella rhizosphaerae]|uniref:Glycine cleavage system H protein n=1 Tax=Hoyosella rhizosphaerae TaxID=1755582 RepID=A0A916TYB0_9ACTN|nr:glycine cleavage system protein GcvH [Hoyosella rhizosphaerae]MBN4927301.1 glycine cleavage system protein GcvH [Hoyosella rhizosphaerae]GGC52359.1 glycine cleavage system H protein [Hoyosella rhizosphaerae]
MSEASLPEELRYTREHEWVQRTGDTSVRIGITDYAQKQLDDVVFVQLPTVGDKVAAGEPLGEVESTKSVSDIFSPISGRVAAVNDALSDSPELVNVSPYDKGWLVELSVSNEETLDAALHDTLDADEYREITGDE